MAIARAQQGGGGAPNILLIAFVALGVISLGITVYLFTQHEDLRNQEQSAKKSASDANRLAGNAQQALRDMANLVLGQTEVSDPAELIRQVADAKARIATSGAFKGVRVAPESSVIDILNGLAGEYQNQNARLTATLEELDSLKARVDTMSTEIAQRKDTYDANAAALAEKVDTLENQTTSSRDQWQQQVADLEARMMAQAREAGEQVDNERRLRLELEEQLKKERERNQGLQKELAAFKPQPDPFAPLQRADGTVVRAMPGSDIVYIDLGIPDGVRRGMTFAVYSKLEGIGGDGKGKATIEIVQVFDATSECRVTSTTPSKPIIQGDLIANPVFDRTRQYRFVVAGAFDLDFDGKIDDPSGERVAAMIRGWGGIVTGQVDTGTDFLVAGVPLTRAAQPEGVEPAATEVRRAQAEAARKAFEDKLQEARALSIPILTRTQFLHFVGQPVPQETPDDSLPMLP